LPPDILKNLRDRSGRDFALFCRLDTRFQVILQFLQGLFFRQGVHIGKGRQGPFQNIILDTFTLERGNGLEPLMLFRCDINGKTAHGLLLLKFVDAADTKIELTGKTIIIALGVLLLVTGALQLLKKTQGSRSEKDLQSIDGILVGIVQGLAILPGLSRSGLTVSTLLLRRFDDAHALKMSFILSLPAVLGGNILLNSNILFTTEAFAALAASFVFGIGTIHILLKIAKRIQFGWFVLGFAFLVFASAFIG